MELILSNNVTSLTGQFGQDHGYAIRRRGTRFFSTRCSNRQVPKDGHLQFIILAAKLSKNGMFLVNIQVPQKEFADALQEAGLLTRKPTRRNRYKAIVPPAISVLDADDVLNFKTFHGL